MKPAPFSYHLPETVDDLLALTDEHSESGRILAGGQSLVPLLNMRRLRVDHIIDINGLGGLNRVQRQGDTLVIGALVRQGRALADPVVSSAAPLVVEAVGRVASATVRNRGTLCGSLAFASPAGQIPAAVLAMGGGVSVRHVSGDRSIDFGDLFTGPFATALRPGEVMTELRLSLWPSHAGYAFVEVGRARWPVVSAASLVELDSNVVSRCAIALAGVADTPVRATTIERAFIGSVPTDELIAALVRGVTNDLDVPTNIYGTSTYRSQVAEVLARRSLITASDRAGRVAQ